MLSSVPTKVRNGALSFDQKYACSNGTPGPGYLTPSFDTDTYRYSATLQGTVNVRAKCRDAASVSRRASDDKCLRLEKRQPPHRDSRNKDAAKLTMTFPTSSCLRV